MDIIKTERINRLFDLYQKLLTPYQKEVFKLYYQEDYSLKEIAETYDVSRNAIFTLLKRVLSSLEDYEKKLELLKKTSAIYEELDKTSLDDKFKNKIKKILEWGEIDGFWYAR